MSTKNLEKALQLMGRLETTAFGSSQGRDEAFAAWKAAKAELETLKSALRPFAGFAWVKVHYVEMIGLADTAIIWNAGDVENPSPELTIRVSDCRAALKALED